MNKKTLLVLAGILIVLVALVVMKKQAEAPPSITEQVKLTSLVPDGVTKAAVTRLELSNGGAPVEKVVLERDSEDPDVWRIASQFNAPGNVEKIEEYLDNAVALQGETRQAEPRMSCSRTTVSSTRRRSASRGTPAATRPHLTCSWVRRRRRTRCSCVQRIRAMSTC